MFNCYSQRLLNPFRGVMNVIEHSSAEAVSLNGVSWDIYIRNDELTKDLESDKKIMTSEFRYGSWSAEQGLKRGPIHPSDDFKRLEQDGDRLYQFLLEHQDTIPFNFKDQFELWLLDNQQQPLALIDSAIRESDMDTEQLIDWRAGMQCRNDFHSAAIQEHLIQTVDCCADYLSHYINELAGETPTAQWFRREPGQQAMGLFGINLDDELLHRQLDNNVFPDFLLATDGHDAAHQQLINDFIDWQAPWLLLLTDLDQTQRLHFEQQAQRRALVVADQYRLYPQVIEPSHIKAARVEAMLRNSQPRHEEQQEDFATYYIELNDPHTN